MGTIKQKKVATALIENLESPTPLTGGEIVENSGYGPSMKKNPQVILNSKGVQNELAALGFDEATAKQVVGEILQYGEEDRDRLKAAEMVFKVFGSFAPTKSVTVNANVEPTKAMLEAAEVLNDHFKKQLTTGGGDGTEANAMDTEERD